MELYVHVFLMALINGFPLSIVTGERSRRGREET